jgi:hypothetical protein
MPVRVAETPQITFECLRYSDFYTTLVFVKQFVHGLLKDVAELIMLHSVEY